MSVNTSCSILHFLEHDIVSNAHNLGISLGSNGKETSKFINDFLNLEANRVLDIIRNIAAVKSMNEPDIKNLGVTALQSLCEDLVPTEGLQNVDEDLVLEGYMASLQPDVISNTVTSLDDSQVVHDKPKRTWNRKVYPTPVVRRSARVKQKKKSRMIHERDLLE